MKLHNLFLIFVYLVTITSCNEGLIENNINKLNFIQDTNKIGYQISNGQSINETDAEFIVNRFYEGTKSRTGEIITINNIVPLCREDGDTAIYAVNYNGGYVLVSKNKNTYPVIAQVDNATFRIDSIPETLSLLINEIIHKPVEVNDSTESENIKAIWRYYEQPHKLERHSKSRANVDYESELDRLIDYWWSENVNFYYLDECKDILPTSVYEEFKKFS